MRPDEPKQQINKHDAHYATSLNFVKRLFWPTDFVQFVQPLYDKTGILSSQASSS